MKVTAHGARGRGVWKWIILAGIGGVLLGVFLGFLAATVMSKRSAYNLAVRDGKAVYEAVRASKGEMAKARWLLDRARSSAEGRQGVPPSVDYDAIEQLRSLPAPFTAGDFVGLNYSKFNRETVNSLFTYARQVDELWDKIEEVTARVPPESSRKERDEAAQDDKAFTAYRQDLAELGELMDSALRTQKSSASADGDGLGDYPLSL